MSYYDLVRRLEERLRRYIDEKIATIVKYGPYSRSTQDGSTDKIGGYQTEGAGEQNYDFDGRRVFPFGLRSLPPTGTFGVWIGKSGRSGDGVIVGAESSRFGPSNLNDGEVAIYNKVNGTTILLDKNGGITVTDKAGNKIQADGTNINVTATAGANVNVSASGTGKVSVSATPVTGTVALGPVGTLPVLVQGALDSLGVPVTQAPAAAATIVKAG